METATIPHIRYNGARHPGNTDPADFFPNLGKGGNCELTAHGITYLRGYRVPRVRSSELWSDTHATEHIIFSSKDFAGIKRGDIVGLAENDRLTMRGIHQGIAVTESDSGLLIAHNARGVGYEIKPFEEIQEDPRHEKIIWVKRPLISKFDPTIYNPDALKQLGLDALVL